MQIRSKAWCAEASALGSTAAAVELTASLRAELAAASARHADALGAMGRSQGQALALRDARVAELRGEIDRVNEALRAAHETIRQLRVEKAGLVRGLDDEKAKAKAAIDSLRAELERVVKMSQDFLAALKSSASPQHTHYPTQRSNEYINFFQSPTTVPEAEMKSS